MNVYETHRSELFALFTPAIEIAQSCGATESVQRLVEAMRWLQDGRLVTVACVEFKRGNSRPLSALLEKPELFPVNVNIATSIISTVPYGASELIEATLASCTDWAFGPTEPIAPTSILGRWCRCGIQTGHCCKLRSVRR